MRDHTLLLLEIIRNPRPDRQVLEELAEYGHSADAPLATLTRNDLIAVLRLFEDGTLDPDELKAWAIRLLSRRDLEFEFGQEGAVEEALFWLGYQELAEWASSELFKHIERMLERRSLERD